MRSVLEQVTARAAKLGATYADARAVVQEYTSISRQDGRADRLSAGNSSGIGIRVLVEGAWGFATTNRTDAEGALACFETAVQAARVAPKRTDIVLSSLPGHEATVATEFEIDPRSVSPERKMETLRAHEDELLRIGGSQAVNTSVGLMDSVTTTWVSNTQGAWVESTETRARIGCSIVTREGDVRQQASEHRAKLGGWETIAGIGIDEFSAKAAKRGVDLLGARRAPAGAFPVVLHPSVVGVFIHEAFGHNAEADLVLAGESILEGKVGEKVASDLVNVIDDATIPGLWGTYAYDHEGTPAARRTIIDQGTLVGFMHSLESSGRMGVAPNGSGRADGYGAMPIVRMSNTILLAGETPVEEMIRGVDEGVLFENGQWGYVFCEKGQYTLSAGSGRMIRNGELCEMVRDVCMCGMVLETLHGVDAVSREWEVSWGGGTCGKNGQSMPVSGGGPWVRVQNMLVGGQEA